MGHKRKNGKQKDIEKLKALLRERKIFEAQEKMDIQVMVDSVRNPPKFRMEKPTIPVAADIRVPKPEPEYIDPNQRPKSLEGFSYGEILLFETDGMLSPEEEKWLKRKIGRYDRQYIAPAKNRWMQ